MDYEARKKTVKDMNWMMPSIGQNVSQLAELILVMAEKIEALEEYVGQLKGANALNKLLDEINNEE